MPKLDEQIKTLAGYFAADCEPDGKLTLQLEVEHFLTRSDGQPPAFADVQAALRDLQQQTDAPIITDGEYFGYSGPALTATLGPACQLCISLAPLRDVQDIMDLYNRFYLQLGLALAAGFDVLSFEYRLAPEHPFPAAIEDAVAMWDYLMYMGYGARDVIVAGDSAGGNLALELALKLKEQGRAQPRGLVLFSPWTDMTASGKSYRTCKTLDPMLTMEYIAAVREAYTGPDADWSRPCYSPLFADLRGLPPTLVQVGTNEILKSDSERLVENLQKAGVYAQLEVYPECWHVFQQMPIRRAAVAMESAGRFVQRII